MFSGGFKTSLSRDSEPRTEGDGSRPPRMYYQYQTQDKIERKVQQGEVISGFTIGKSSKIFIAYGTKRRSGLRNYVVIEQFDRGRGKYFFGLGYVKARTTSVRKNVSVKSLEKLMNHYCLKLPLVEQGCFGQHYGIIYDDWDVGDINFRKVLPGICHQCFSCNILP